MDDVSNQF